MSYYEQLYKLDENRENLIYCKKEFLFDFINIYTEEDITKCVDKLQEKINNINNIQGDNCEYYYIHTMSILNKKSNFLSNIRSGEYRNIINKVSN